MSGRRGSSLITNKREVLDRSEAYGAGGDFFIKINADMREDHINKIELLVGDVRRSAPDIMRYTTEYARWNVLKKQLPTEGYLFVNGSDRFYIGSVRFYSGTMRENGLRKDLPVFTPRWRTTRWKND